MRLVLLVLVLAAFATDAGPGFGAGGGLSTCPKGYIGGGLTPCTLAPSYAFFEFAPASGAGMGTACACTAVTGAKGETMTFARASAAECPSNDGQTLTQCGNNLPRVSSGTAASGVLGVWIEDTRTNYLLYPRDWSQAAWTKTNMTCAKTATGMGSDSNGASTCTSTAPNGTAWQVIVGTGTHSASFYIKRRTGTGTVEITRNGGSSWANITSSLSGSWRRVVSSEAPGCAGGNCIVVSEMVSSAANPTPGIRVGTSGDSVDVDFGQDEIGPFPSSPIDQTAVASTRAAEVISAPNPSPSLASAGCARIEVISASITSSISYALVATNAAALPIYSVTSGDTVRTYDGTNDVVTTYVSVPGVSNDFSSSWTGATIVVQNITSGFRNIGSFDGSMAQTGLWFGSANGGSTGFGVYKKIVIDQDFARCVTDAITWMGDSIVAGVGSTPSTPPQQLGGLLHRVTINGGLAGDTTAQCAARWTSTFKTQRASAMIWSCAVNDCGLDYSGTAAAANAQAVVSDAVGLGRRVTVTGVMPWATSGGWSAPRGTECDTYNAAMSAWCPSHGCTYVSTDSLGTGSPLTLQAGYDSGDHIHPNAAGAAALAALVQAANP